MAKQRSGQYFTCPVCGREFYRTPSQIARGASKTCSKACLGELFSGDGNPFWGKEHSPETKTRVSNSRKGKAKGNQNAKGHKHSEEARKKIADASRQLWKEHRDKMLAALPRGEAHHFHKQPELRRYRKNFSPRHRREWAETKCVYCGAENQLELDHIIPVFDGGTNDRSNAQTLCRSCNMWKLYAVDLPRYYARLGRQGGRN